MSHQITLIPGDGIRPEITKTTPLGKGFKSINLTAKCIEKVIAWLNEQGEKVTKAINPNNFVGTAKLADAVIEAL